MFKNRWKDSEGYNKYSGFQYKIAKKILNSSNFKGNEEVLDIGCGDGKITYEIANRINSGHVIGIDISPQMIEFATNNYSKDNITYRVYDALDLNSSSFLGKKFDLVVSFFLLPWIHAKEELFKNIKKVLKNQGKLFLLAAIFSSEQVSLIENLIKKQHWVDYFSDYESIFQCLNDKNYIQYAKNCGINIECYETFKIQHSFKSKEEIKNFFILLIPHIDQLPNSNTKEKFASELLEDYFKLKKNEDYTIEFEMIKFQGNKISFSFFCTEDLDDEKTSFVSSTYQK